MDCPTTNDQKLFMTKRLTTEEFIARVKRRHNKRFDLSQIEFRGMRSPLSLRCAIHDVTCRVEMASQFCSGNPCEQCRREEKLITHREKLKTKIKVDYPHVDVMNPPNEFNGTTQLYCRIHQHHFERRSEAIIFGRTNCDLCSKESALEKITGSSRVSFEEYVAKFHERHGDALTIVTENTDYQNYSSLIKVKCRDPSHGTHEKTALNWLKNNGCPSCNESQGERLVRLALTQLNIAFQREKTFATCRDRKELPFDFWLPDWGVLIEFQGRQHFEAQDRFGGELAFKGTNRRDEIKRGWAQSNNLRLLYISTYVVSEIRKLISDALEKINDTDIQAKVASLYESERQWENEKWSGYLSRLQEKHGDSLSFDETVWHRGQREIDFVCRIHGLRTGDLYGLLKGHTCSLCAGNEVTREMLIERSTQKFGVAAFYYEKLVFSGMSEDAVFVCAIHGEQIMTPERHLTLKYGCRECSHVAADFSPDSFLRKAVEKFGDNRFDYSELNYRGTSVKCQITCIKHSHTFQILPGDHIRVDKTDPTKYSSGGCEFCVKELVSELKSKPIEVLGVRYSSKTAACDAFGISRSVVTARLRRNWSTDDAFTVPKGAQRKNK